MGTMWTKLSDFKHSFMAVNDALHEIGRPI